MRSMVTPGLEMQPAGGAAAGFLLTTREDRAPPPPSFPTLFSQRSTLAFFTAPTEGPWGERGTSYEARGAGNHGARFSPLADVSMRAERLIEVNRRCKSNGT